MCERAARTIGLEICGIDEAARVAAQAFDLIVVREDRDPPGRLPGATAELIREVARMDGPAAPGER